MTTEFAYAIESEAKLACRQLFFLVLVLCAGCVSQATKERAAVAVAWAEFKTARTNYLRDAQPPRAYAPGVYDRFARAVPNYLKALESIDTKGCPSEFREAFVEYRQAVERGNVSNLQGALELGAALFGEFGGVQQLSRRAALAADARFKLERLAVRYGAE